MLGPLPTFRLPKLCSRRLAWCGDASSHTSVHVHAPLISVSVFWSHTSLPTALDMSSNVLMPHASILLAQVVYTLGTLENPALTCQARPQEGEVSCVQIIVEYGKGMQVLVQNKLRSTDILLSHPYLGESRTCHQLHRDCCSHTSRTPQVFGEFPPRCQMSDHTKFPVIVPSPTPG